MISSSVNSPIYSVNRLFYLKVQCKITAAVFLTLRWYLSVSNTSLASPEAKSPEQYIPLTDEEIKLLALRTGARLGGRSDPRHPTMLHDEETIVLTYHPSHDTNTAI
jgi:hypothetical protein